MAGQSNFDPYAAWLSLSGVGPIDHYRLLGIEQLESDPAVIQAAFVQRISALSNYTHGPQGDYARRLIEEISAAHIVLMNPATKLDYDRQLTSGNYPPPLPTLAKRTDDYVIRQESHVERSPAAVDLFAEEFEPARRSRPYAVTRRRKKRNPVIGTMLGGVLGTGIGCVIVYFMLFHNVEAPIEKAPEPDRKPAAKRPIERRRPQPDLNVDDDEEWARKHAPRDLRPPDDNRKGGKPAEVAQPVIIVNAANPPKKLPELEPLVAPLAAGIPEAGNLKPVEVATVNGENPVLDLLTHTSIRTQFELVVGKEEWLVHLKGSDKPVAKFTLEDPKLYFAWLPDAPAEAACLCNSVVKVACGEVVKHVPLRKVVAQDPVEVNLEKATVTTSLDVPLNDLKPSALKLEIVGMTGGVDIDGFKPPKPILPTGKSILVVLRKEPPSACLDVRMTPKRDNSGVEITVKPIMMKDTADEMPFTTAKMTATLNGRAARLKATAALPDAQQSFKSLSARQTALPNLIAKAPNPFVAQQLQFELTENVQAVEKLVPMIQQMERDKNLCPVEIAGLQELAELGRQFHQVSGIRYRIYYEVGPTQVEVVNATSISAQQ